MVLQPLPPILIWHPKRILAEGLVAWCERLFPGHPPCLADSPDHGVVLAMAAHPVVALVDVDTAPAAALGLIRRLSLRRPPVPAVALTLYPADLVEAEALRAGALACVCVSTADDRLAGVVGAILRAARGSEHRP